MIAAAVLVAALALLVAPAGAAAQDPPPVPLDRQPVILVVDVSGSMADDADDTDNKDVPKIDGARLALLDYLGTVEDKAPIGLRTYPNQEEGSACNAGKAVIPVEPVDPEEMSAKIRGLEADGDTPTAEAMLAAADDLKPYQGGTLVIVSDGESTCGDPCKAARDIADRGIDVDAITVGFQISDEGREELECISNALEGRYLDIEQSDELRDTLDRLGRPRLEVKLSGTDRPQAVAGGEYVEIGATVTNTGEVEARDVIGHLGFEDRGVDVRRPIGRLGNLPPQTSREVVWRVTAGPSTAGRSIPFTIVGRALNVSATGKASGQLESLGVTRAEDAGAILKGRGRGLAILGDSYSAGEGADAYTNGTDHSGNACHRSEKTYLMEQLGRDEVQLLACSGAVSANIAGPYERHGERPQIGRLKDIQKDEGPLKAVAMTIGGNDAGFGGLAASCLFGPAACNSKVFEDAPFDTSGVGSEEFLKEKLVDSDLREDLTETYAQVNRTLNPKEVVERRKAVAPILVLGYPLPVPLNGRSCPPMGWRIERRRTKLGLMVPTTTYFLNEEEIDYVVEFAVKLNGVVEEAVEAARRNEDVPVFFVPSTEVAFQPRHTACDSGDDGTATEPYARSVFNGNTMTVGGNGFNGAGADVKTLLALMSPGPLLNPFRVIAGKDVFDRSKQEIAHPNAKGYAAETLAILRWTRSRAARLATDFVRTAEPAKPVPTSWVVSDRELGQLGGGQPPQLQGGTSYGLTLQGFHADSTARLVLRSTPRLLGFADADAEGRIKTRVPIPRDLEGGKHTLEVSGLDPDLRPRTVRIPFTVDRPFRPALLSSMAAGSGVALLLGFGLLGATGYGRRMLQRLPD